jgi:copper ion binding protein
MKKVISIEGMSCNHCVKHVTDALKAIEGVSKVEVSLKNGKAIIEAENTVSNAEIIDAVNDAGYDVISVK